VLLVTERSPYQPDDFLLATAAPPNASPIQSYFQLFRSFEPELFSDQFAEAIFDFQARGTSHPQWLTRCDDPLPLADQPHACHRRGTCVCSRALEIADTASPSAQSGAIPHAYLTVPSVRIAPARSPPPEASSSKIDMVCLSCGLEL
jgi:hypothetical protein